MAAIFAYKKSRELLRGRGRNGVDYRHEQAGNLRESAGGIVKMGNFIGPQCDSVENDTEAESQACREEGRETRWKAIHGCTLDSEQGSNRWFGQSLHCF